MTRDDLIRAGTEYLKDRDPSKVDPVTFLLALSDALFPERDSAPPQPKPLDYGVWIDDPPRIVLRRRYLDRLRSLPLSHVAVMADGPEPGLTDARWDGDDLAELAQALPDLRRVLTVWVSPTVDAVGDLRSRLPAMAGALRAHAVEADAEPVGGWSPKGVSGYGSLREAAGAVAGALLQPGLGAEVTVFPGALRYARVLVDALVAQADPEQEIRLLLQAYAVRHRGERKIQWDGPLGPLYLPGDSIRAARSALPPRVEICYGRAVYDTGWPGGRDSLQPGTVAALDAGARTVRDWSSKWLCRLAGHERRRAEVARVHARALELVG